MKSVKYMIISAGLLISGAVANPTSSTTSIIKSTAAQTVLQQYFQYQKDLVLLDRQKQLNINNNNNNQSIKAKSLWRAVLIKEYALQQVVK